MKIFKNIHYSYKLHLLIGLMLFFMTWGFGSYWYEYSHRVAILVVIVFAIGKELNDVFGVIKFLLTSNKREFSKKDFAVGFFPSFFIYMVIEMITL